MEEKFRINAGSATRATCTALIALGTRPAAVGALPVVGEMALPAFTANGLAIECVAYLPNQLWEPAACLMCAAGLPFSTLLAFP